MKSVDLADFASFARALGRSRALQLAAAAATVVLAVLVYLAAPRSAARTDPLLRPGSSTVVVLDLSASISWDTYARIATTLDGLRRSGGRAGLIVFSDTAYEALPPGTPAAELQQFERFFVVRRPGQPGLQPQPPRNPWTDTFSSGTRISTGLRLALDVIQSNALHKPRVLLVSDLDDDATDLESLTSIALAYRKLGVPISIAALNPSQEDAASMQRLLPHSGSLVDVPLQARPEARLPTRFPVLLVVLTALLAAAIAVLLVLTNRLSWSTA